MLVVLRRCLGAPGLRISRQELERCPRSSLKYRVAKTRERIRFKYYQ